jgi:cation:H+ antiporter
MIDDMNELILFGVAVLGGLAALVWSAGLFVDGAASLAKILGLPTLLIGMVIVGFGTSMPELTVSALSAADGSPAIALGNAVGSNIVNIGLILGLTALIKPIAVASTIVRRELPVLLGVSALGGLFFLDGALSRWEAGLFLALFGAIMGLTIRTALRGKGDELEAEYAENLSARRMGPAWAAGATLIGLAVLVLSSRALVWGAVGIARGLGVSELVIGLTIVALGTSLPELASSIAAARKGEHDLALGNVIGSNFFNTLAVIGLAGAIRPIAIDRGALARDWGVMLGLTAVLLVMGMGFKRPGRINRFEGAALIILYAAYILVVATASGAA